jgi:serine/threonine protein kinase
MVDPWEEKAVFLEALAVPEAERDAFLLQRCSDAALRARVADLLDRHRDLTMRLVANRDPSSIGPTLLPGDGLDEFVIVRHIESGGMGEVYLAEDSSLSRRVALKLLSPAMGSDPKVLDRFRAEAKAAAALSNRRIVPVYSVGACRGRHYIASEFVDGPTFAAVIASTRASFDGRMDRRARSAWARRVCEVGRDVAEALKVAHQAHLVHCDVKPSNILIDPASGARLTDFGIAREMGRDPTLSIELAGSVHYMSPEQASLSSTVIDARSDVYSLGVVLYEALALRRPFDGRTVPEVLEAVRESAPPPLRRIVPSVSRDLETIVHTAIHKDPARRYQSAEAFRQDLDAVLDGGPIRARPEPLLRKVARKVKGRRTTIATVCALGFAGGAGVLWRAWANDRADRELWLSIDAEGAPSDVWVRRARSSLLDGFGEAQHLGRTPLEARLEPGAYRVIVVAPDRRAMSEFDCPVGTPGAAGRRELRVCEDWPSIRSEEKEFRLFGRFVVFEAHPAVTVPSVELPSAPDGEGGTSEPVLVESFALDQREASRREFAAFASATKWPLEFGWTFLSQAPDDFPVTAISPADAAAFARYRGQRLLTMHEFEAAARGPELRNHPDPASARGRADASAEALRTWISDDWDGRRDLVLRSLVTTVTDDPAPLPLGVHFLIGNAREMTSSVLDMRNQVIKGAAWLEDITRYRFDERSEMPAMGDSDVDVGFRCARSEHMPGS